MIREPGQWLMTGHYLPITCALCGGPVAEHVSVDLKDKSKLWACTCGRTYSLQLPEGELDLGVEP